MVPDHVRCALESCAMQDIAIESADMVLMRGKLHDVLTALSLSRAILRRIKINFGWAFGYNWLVSHPTAPIQTAHDQSSNVRSILKIID